MRKWILGSEGLWELWGLREKTEIHGNEDEDFDLKVRKKKRR